MDYAATTPLRAEVREAMAPFLADRFGNPSSTHRWGREASAALEEARAHIADALGAQRREILFVQGGTESDNLAVLGLVAAARARGQSPLVATTTIEHKAVLEAARSVEASGGEVTWLPVDEAGVLSEEALAAALARKPCVLSVMWVNNEVGIVQPIADIAARASRCAVPTHTDAVQAVGKLPVRLDETPVDCLSLTGHKIYGPKGTGALFVRDGTELAALLHGGGQERGLRPGTQDVAGAVGLAEAVTLAVSEQPAATARLRVLRDQLESRLASGLPSLLVHGRSGHRAPHILSVGVRGIRPDLLVAALDLEGLAVSGGSACASDSVAASHVLTALYGQDAPPAMLRFSLGHTTSATDVERAAAVTIEVVRRLGADAAATVTP